MITRQKFSLHNHTWRCGHAVGNDDQMVKAAIAHGLVQLGISDHAPYHGIHVPADRMDMSQLEEYLASMHTVRSTYHSAIDFYFGFEFDYFPSRHQEAEHLLSISDYLVLGLHTKDEKNVANDEYCFYCDDEDVVFYANSLRNAMASGLFAFCAHPDFFMLGRTQWSEACTKAAHIICEASLQYNVPLEVNLNGMRYGRQRYLDGSFFAYPYRSFWEIVAEHGCKVLYGHDAHKPLDFMEDWKLKECETILDKLKLHWIQFSDLHITHKNSSKMG